MTDNQDTALAFRWLDNFFYTPLEESAPDEAFDWIFMTDDEDWRLLEQAWEERPPDWREACAYILSQGPLPESLPLLHKALFDQNQGVALQGACSLAGQRLDCEEEVPLDAGLIARLEELFALVDGQYMEEVEEVLQKEKGKPLKG